jgi:hypothetical protein
MITMVRCKLSSQAHDRLSPAPQHTTREAKSTANESSPHTPRHHSCSRGGQATDKRSRIARTRPLPSTSTVWPLPAATCTILVGESSCSGVVRRVVSPRPSCPYSLLPVAHACTLTQQANKHNAPRRQQCKKAQCEQCRSSAASGRYQPRARNANDHNGTVQAVFSSPRQTLPHPSTVYHARRAPQTKPVRTHT